MTKSRGRARFGVLVPFTNTNLEPDMTMLRSPGVSIHFQRIGGYDRDEVPDDSQMAGLGEFDLTEPLDMLLGAKPDVILYGCTSATLTHGSAFDRDLASKIQTQSGAETVTAAGSLVNAMRTIGADRIAFASPYVGAINDMAVDYFAGEGVETVSRADIGVELGNYGQGELTPDQVFELATRADSADAQAMVLSCTDMRSVETVERLEAALGKPVLCSNQAMVFQAMQKLHLPMGDVNCGTLFRQFAEAAA